MKHQFLLSAALALTLTGCASGSTQPTAGAPSPATKAGPTVQVAGEDAMKFEPTEIRVPAGQTVTVEFTNEGKILHDFHTRGQAQDAAVIATAGSSQSGSFTSAQPGSYEYYCSQPGHEQAGMKGTLIVE